MNKNEDLLSDGGNESKTTQLTIAHAFVAPP